MPKSTKRSLNAQFIASAHEVKVFYDGQLVVHTTLDAGKALSHLFSIRGGAHQMETLPKLDLRVIEGPCAISVGGAKAKTLKSGSKLNLPPGSVFTLKATGACAVVLGTPKPGPGLDDGLGSDDVLA